MSRLKKTNKSHLLYSIFKKLFPDHIQFISQIENNNNNKKSDCIVDRKKRF